MFCELWRWKTVAPGFQTLVHTQRRPCGDTAMDRFAERSREWHGTRRKHSVLLCAFLGGRWCCWQRNGAAEAAELLRQTPADNCNNDGSQNSSEISRHHSGWRCPQNFKQRCYDLWELWVWRSISSFACTSGCVWAAQTFPGSNPEQKVFWELCLPTCWCGNFRFPDISGTSRGKTRAGIVAGVLFLRGRVALFWALIICCFMESLWGARHTPGLIDHVQAAVKLSPCSGLLLNMSLWTVGKWRFRPFKCEMWHS